VEFPGKKHWEEDVSVAATGMVEEADKAASRLQAIVDDNQNVLAGHDLAASARLRERWIDALLPYAMWQHRMRDLEEDGKARAKAYATGNPAGVTQDHHDAVRRNELAVAGVLSSLHIPEDQIKEGVGALRVRRDAMAARPSVPGASESDLGKLHGDRQRSGLSVGYAGLRCGSLYCRCHSTGERRQRRAYFLYG
jgi:hypothetical protein